MGNRPNPRSTWNFDLAAFLAILVTAIILISVLPTDPRVVQSVVDLTAAYLAVRVAGDRRPADRRRGG